MTPEMKKLYAQTEALWTEVMEDYRLLPTITEQARFWDQVVDNYESQHRDHLEAARFCLETLRDRGLLASCESVLEIGCATGDLTRMLARELPAVTASDISPAMIARMQDINAQECIWNVTGLCGDYMELPEEPGYDLVGASLVPTTYSERGLRKMLALSRKGGFFVCGCGAVAEGNRAYRELGQLLLGNDRPVKQDPIYPFSLLYALGKYPEIRFRFRDSVQYWDEETAVRKLQLYFRNSKEMPPDRDQIIVRYVHEHLEKGSFPMVSRSSFAVITWIER